MATRNILLLPYKIFYFVRNTIFDIPKVSFLLSHILIKVGDILDIGDKGLYEVVKFISDDGWSGDTLTFERGGETLTILNLSDERMVA
jgi:hypothetical protein